MEKIWNLAAFKKTETLFIYVNFRSEVETYPIINRCLAENISVAVPFTDPHNAKLIPYIISDPATDLKPGYCGIPEPDPAIAKTCDPSQIDTVVLPGSVFDAHGGRLGYGGGFYDRFLEHDAPAAYRIGIAYEMQVVESVPMLPHDQRVHTLVTEKRTINVAG